tara:strand:+ start:31986 stop:32240 length:255 start_codon:yes stop_codon:yes gene_type:complete
MSRTTYFICLFSLILLGLFVFKFNLIEKGFPENPYATLFFLLVYCGLAMLIHALRRKRVTGSYFFNIFSMKALANDTFNRFKGF